MYTGGTTLLTEAYTPAEKARTQGANDFIVFSIMGVSSFSSGALVSAAGWEMMNWGALPVLVLIARCRRVVFARHRAAKARACHVIRPSTLSRPAMSPTTIRDVRFFRHARRCRSRSPTRRTRFRPSSSSSATSSLPMASSASRTCCRSTTRRGRSVAHARDLAAFARGRDATATQAFIARLEPRDRVLRAGRPAALGAGTRQRRDVGRACAHARRAGLAHAGRRRAAGARVRQRRLAVLLRRGTAGRGARATCGAASRP